MDIGGHIFWLAKKLPQTGCYRPISLLLRQSKVVEKIVANHFINLLQSKKINSNEQYGLPAGHSTVHALLNGNKFETT